MNITPTLHGYPYSPYAGNILLFQLSLNKCYVELIGGNLPSGEKAMEETEPVMEWREFRIIMNDQDDGIQVLRAKPICLRSVRC